MKKYIEAVSAAELIAEKMGVHLCDMVDIIADVPAADVAEVVHGEWETDRDTIRCSVCGFGYFPRGYFFKDGQCVGGLIFVRCPQCGAKMDREKEGV